MLKRVQHDDWSAKETLSYSRADMHDARMTIANNRAEPQIQQSRQSRHTPPPCVRARLRAHVGANFANFRGVQQ